MTTLNLPCGKDLNHLRIQLGDGLNLTALIDHLESCEKCSQCQGEVVRELNGLMVGGEQVRGALHKKEEWRPSNPQEGAHDVKAVGNPLTTLP